MKELDNLIGSINYLFYTLELLSDLISIEFKIIYIKLKIKIFFIKYRWWNK